MADPVPPTRRRVDPDDPSSVEIRRVEPVMGTVVSLAAWGRAACPAPAEAAIARAAAWLHEVDDRFTTYRPSEWTRVTSGSLALDDAHPDIRHVLDRCRRLEEETGGAFSLTAGHARSARSAPRAAVPDPAAYVKGWATQRAAELVLDAGAAKVCVNCGGDVAVAGGAGPWRIGVQDPFDPARLRGVIEVARGGVATSGLYARGEHLFDPATGQPARGWASITVVGPDLGLADAYSTALFAAGPGPAPWFDRLPAYSAYLIGTDGATSTMRFELR